MFSCTLYLVTSSRTPEKVSGLLKAPIIVEFLLTSPVSMRDAACIQGGRGATYSVAMISRMINDQVMKIQGMKCSRSRGRRVLAAIRPLAQSNVGP